MSSKKNSLLPKMKNILKLPKLGTKSSKDSPVSSKEVEDSSSMVQAY